MYDKETFALLTRKVWNMLSENTKFSATVSTTINRLTSKPFRENVARAVLQSMTSELNRTVLPAPSESGEKFIDAVAFAFAYLAEDDRPPKFTAYTPSAFAEMLIVKFCSLYAERDVAAPTDDVQSDDQATLAIPTCSAEALSLRQRIRSMPVTQFGQYSLSR